MHINVASIKLSPLPLRQVDPYVVTMEHSDVHVEKGIKVHNH
jgi:hypothetical protein